MANSYLHNEISLRLMDHTAYNFEAFFNIFNLNCKQFRLYL
jgi:hypothetical protein